MGLWLKCPKCQMQNPLSARVCSHCGQDLDKLSADQRVYVIGPAAAAPPATPPTTAPAPGEEEPATAPAGPEAQPVAAAPPAPTQPPEPKPASAVAKKNKRTKKKKS